MFGRMLDEIERFTPETGANLVGFDDYEPLGEKLYLLGHYDTVKEANAEMARRRRRGFADEMFVYEAILGPSREELVAAGIDMDLWAMKGLSALPEEMRAKLQEMIGRDQE